MESKYTLGAHELGHVMNSDSAEFISITSGRSIVSGADWGGDRFELGLSGDGMIRVFWTKNGLHVNYLSTTNVDEVPPLIIKMVDGPRRLPARLLEKRIRSLRNLYAIIQLAMTDRLYKTEKELATNIDIDFEKYLAEDEVLYLECLAPGSWYITVWTKSKSAYKYILLTFSLVYGKGRDSLLRKLESEARLKELEVQRKEFELFSAKVDWSIGLAKKLKSVPATEKMRQQIISNLSGFLLEDSSNEGIQKIAYSIMEGEK